MRPLAAKFLKSAAEYGQCIQYNKAEFAFVGRSNVGKSSLINSIVGGREYGYAKVSRSKKDVFQSIVSDYLLNRESLKCVFQLIDSKYRSVSPRNVRFRTGFATNYGY